MRFRITVQAVIKGKPKLSQSATVQADNISEAMSSGMLDESFDKLPEDIDKSDVRAIMFSVKRV